MAAPQSAGSGTGPNPGPGLFDSLRSFWSVLLAILYTRLDLATDELGDQARRAVQVVVAAVIGIVALVFAFIIANIFLIALFWDTPYRLLVIGLVFGFYLLIGLVGSIATWNMVSNWPKLLQQTIAELRRDVEGLTRSIAAKKDES